MQMQTCSSHSPPQTQAGLPANQRICWNHANETTLIQVLHNNISGITSNDMFKDMIFKIMVSELSKKPENAGQKFDVEKCKRKWQQVCIYFVMFYL